MAARDDLAGMIATLPMLATDGLDAPETAPAATVLPEAAFLQYTSGSTGAPKGVVVTHANLWHNSGLIHRAFGHGPASLALGWLPPFHDMGLVGSILQPLFGGFPGVLMAPSSFLKRPLSWLQAISRFGATTSGGPNFAYDVCVSKLRPEAMEGVDLSRWRVAFNGAEPVRAATMARFAAAFAPWGFRAEAFYPCYGMAEATLIITGGRPDRPARTLRVNPDALAEGHLALSTGPEARELVSSGHVLGDQRLRVVDPLTHRPLPPGRVGEIWLSGPSVASGYWQRPDGEDFAARLAGDEGESFLRTGDLGALWDGELLVTGRLKDVIIVDGANHYPQDLEWSAQQSHPALRADGGAAFALTDGAVEQVVLVHELQPAVAEADGDAAIAAIRAALSLQHGLAAAAIVLLPPGGLPRTSSGKVRRRACRDAFLAGTLGARAEWRSAAFSPPDGPRPSPV
jgi:acyl-CoA synthetase (AMP-forming)/AMP-acid ligase II